MASKDTASGPLLPNGRRRTSTRNTRPLASASSSAPTSPRARRRKNSLLSSARGPSQVPACSKANIRSTSDEKLSSSPPSLPMPSTVSSTGWPCAPRGWPSCSTCQPYRCARAPSMQASASADSAVSVSSRLAHPARSRQAMRSISRWRSTRSACRRSASSARLASAACTAARTAGASCAVSRRLLSISSASNRGCVRHTLATNSLVASTPGAASSQAPCAARAASSGCCSTSASTCCVASRSGVGSAPRGASVWAG